MQLTCVKVKSESELIIKKSKFLSFLIPVKSELEIKKILNEFQKTHKTATHICYAYIISPNIEKCYDDGEPSGTAGLPMLTFLKQNNIINTLAVVIRYFGGVKLGAGGLIRAYKNAVKEVYLKAELVVYKELAQYETTISYDELNSIYQTENWYQITNIKYDEQITITLQIEKERLVEFKEKYPNINLVKKETI